MVRKDDDGDNDDDGDGDGVGDDDDDDLTEEGSFYRSQSRGYKST